MGGLDTELDALSAARIEAIVGCCFCAMLLWRSHHFFAQFLMGSAIFGVIFLWPVWRVAEPLVEACVLDELTIATINLSGVNDQLDDTLTAVERLDVDILATQETSAQFLAISASLSETYPYVSPRDLNTADTVFIWSKRPIVEMYGDLLELPHTQKTATASVIFGGEALEILAVHIARPIVGFQKKDLVKILTPLQRMSSRHRLVLGDFNAAPWSDVVRYVERESGTQFYGGLLRTWSGVYPTPWPDLGVPAPFGNQLDHILASDRLHLDRFETIPIPGSVHRAVAARVRVGEMSMECRGR
ncbi:MAG: endonuclease/exonuclease/phosphatase family protein [Pseudomonadota bacterium]